MLELYPMKLKAELHVKVWGGRRLASEMNLPLETDAPYGEAWLLHDSTEVINGVYAGEKLGDLVRRFGQDLIGDNDPAEGLPLLAKLLDANDWLSVQVHPNDEQAKTLERDPRGKSEAWLILACDAGAKLVIGVKPGTTQQEMAQAIQENQLENLLVYADVEVDDVLYVEANTIHAIGPGILLYEIQQSSDITYRLYDWGRAGLDGKARDLHVEKGVQVSNQASLPVIQHVEEGSPVTVVKSPYFVTWRYDIGEGQKIETRGYFHAISCLEGQIELTAHEKLVKIEQGESVFIPAAITAYQLQGQGRVLVSAQA